MLIYVICHNDESQMKAQEIESKINSVENCRSHVVRIQEHNILFESQIFNYLDTCKEQWINEDYVGMVTYSIETKTKVDITELIRHIKAAQNHGADIIPVYSLSFKKLKKDLIISFAEALTIMHGPYILLAYKEILDALGYTEQEYFNEGIPSYFSNWWMVRPQYMEKYVEFFKRTLHVIEFNNKLSKYLYMNSYYTGNLPVDTLMKIGGKPYYTLHPFLFERLPCFFFYNLGIKHGIISRGEYLLHD